MEKRNSRINRRQALAAVAGGAAGLILSGSSGFAAEKAGLQSALRLLAGKVFFTEDTPGRWKGKAYGHSPLIKTDKKGTGLLIRAATRHPMEPKHHIVKHMLMDADFRFVKEQVFDIVFDMPRSRFELNNYSGRIYIVSLCNLHDNWVSWTDV